MFTYFSDFWVLFRAIFDKSIVLNVHDENYPKLDVLVDRQQAKRLNVLNNWPSKDEPILLFTNSGSYEMFNFYLLLYTFYESVRTNSTGDLPFFDKVDGS